MFSHRSTTQFSALRIVDGPWESSGVLIYTVAVQYCYSYSTEATTNHWTFVFALHCQVSCTSPSPSWVHTYSRYSEGSTSGVHLPSWDRSSYHILICKSSLGNCSSSRNTIHIQRFWTNGFYVLLPGRRSFTINTSQVEEEYVCRNQVALFVQL